MSSNYDECVSVRNRGLPKDGDFCTPEIISEKIQTPHAQLKNCP